MWGRFAAVSAVMFLAGLVLLAPATTSVGAVSVQQASFAMYKGDLRQTGAVPLTSNIVAPEVLWSFYIGNKSSPVATGDINGDGQIEVVFGAKNFIVYALDHEGNLLWTFATPSWIVSAPAIGDIDGDGLNEVVITDFWWPNGGNSVYALDGVTGAQMWKFSAYQYYEQGYQASPLLYDINGDGALDVLIGSWEYHFYALNGPTGGTIWKSERYSHMIKATAPIADIDKDGVPEVVTADNHAVVKVRNALTGAIEWQRTMPDYGVDATPAVEDINGDGWYEIVFSLIGWEPYRPGGTIALDHLGNVLWHNIQYTYFYTSPTVADVDGDGIKDVISGNAEQHTIIAYRGYDGAVLWANPMPGTEWVGGALLSLDIDSDGTTEILAAASPDLYCLDSRTGAIEWNYSVPYHAICGQFAVSDINLDGKAEILVGYDDFYLYALHQPEPGTPADATVRVAGTKGNTVTVTVLEDGKAIASATVLRTAGEPNTAVVNFEMKAGREYSLRLDYSAAQGSNPVWVDAAGMQYFNNFNSQKGMSQSAEFALG